MFRGVCFCTLHTLTPTVLHGLEKVVLFCLYTKKKGPERNGFAVPRLRQPRRWGAGPLPAAPGTSRVKASALKIDTTTRNLPSLGQKLQLLIEQPSR